MCTHGVRGSVTPIAHTPTLLEIYVTINLEDQFPSKVFSEKEFSELIMKQSSTSKTSSYVTLLSLILHKIRAVAIQAHLVNGAAAGRVFSGSFHLCLVIGNNMVGCNTNLPTRSIGFTLETRDRDNHFSHPFSRAASLWLPPTQTAVWFGGHPEGIQ